VTYNHFEAARCMFVDGPVAIYICEAGEADIRDAIGRVSRLAYIAARLMNHPEENRDANERLLRNPARAPEDQGHDPAGG